MKNKKPTLTAVGGTDVPETKQAKAFYRELEIDTLARTLWGEARSDGHIGMQAVAHVILNRVKVAQEKGGRYWWGNNIIQVCQKPYQFSCWNRSDPNFQKLQAVGEGDLYFKTALRIARRAIIGALDDITGGATHYHADYVSPYWARGKKPSFQTGRHIFYKMVEL